MAKKLDDVLVGGVYEYYRTDNDEIVYRGSTEHQEDQWGQPLEKVDKWHREGENIPTKYKYSWTVFRSNLRRPFGNKVQVRWCIEPYEMTREELLTIEGEKIREKQDEGQCYLNHDPNPLKSWRKYNG